MITYGETKTVKTTQQSFKAGGKNESTNRTLGNPETLGNALASNRLASQATQIPNILAHTFRKLAAEKMLRSRNFL